MLTTVLLVDDDRDDREIFMEALAEVDQTINCITAENGEEAIQKLNKGDLFPNYIFLDLNMPRMNGRECLLEIKNLEAFAKTPVIIYTTSSLQREKEELVRLGASKFITKPANFNDLCYSLKNLLQLVTT